MYIALYVYSQSSTFPPGTAQGTRRTKPAPRINGTSETCGKKLAGYDLHSVAPGGGKGWVRGGEVGEGRITAFRSVLSGSGLVKFIGIFKIFSFLNIYFSLLQYSFSLV